MNNGNGNGNDRANVKSKEEKLGRQISALSTEGISTFFYKSIDSTNTEAKRYAQVGGKIPALFIADEQTEGRGRMGRSFYSPADTGIYMSLLLVAPENEENTLRMTSAAAVAAHDAILAVLGIDTGIKWVNDLYLDGKKISGILAESFFMDDRRFVVIGVGINLSTKDFPEELREKAGSLSDEQNDDIKIMLTQELAIALLREMRSLDAPSLMSRYRKHSLALGRKVVFTENGVSRSGVAENVDDLGALLVRLSDGSLYRLGSGEISLKLS
jgi:BirA family biotin operon repressor/biotin-[acetyl-CoA-carboxylase] ligase